jgi:hypothetical protein
MRWAAIAATILLTACELIGPASINYSRARYNDAVHHTAAEQVLANIVRASDHEPILVMELTEIDAVQTLQGVVTGGASSIGATSGKLGAASISLEYQEAPTIRYQPLQGQPLIAQLSTAINVDSLSSMFDSQFPISAVLSFAANYLTPNAADSAEAINAISQLDYFGAVSLAGTKSDLTTRFTPTGGVTSRKGLPGQSNGNSLGPSATSLPANDSLTIYLEQNHPDNFGQSAAVVQKKIGMLWQRLRAIYRDTQPKSKNPHWIELRTVPIPSTGTLPTCGNAPCKDLAPIMRTRSALGMLQGATAEYDPLIAFVRPDTFQRIRTEEWNRSKFWGQVPDFYTLLTNHLCDNPGIDTWIAPDRCAAENSDDSVRARRIDDYLNSFEPKKRQPDSLYTYELWKAADYRMEEMLAEARRFILIIVDDHLPQNQIPYVAYSNPNNGKWYYIAADDQVSKKNFALIAHFLSIMAIPSANQPLTPTIGVGSK